MITFISKCGDFESSYDDAFSNNQNLAKCESESLKMLETADISNPGNVIDLNNTYIWLNNNKVEIKAKEKDNGILSSSTSNLPNEYQEVEYIESTGTQYIAPGIETDSSIYWYAKFSISSLKGSPNSNYNNIVGANSAPQIAVSTNQWSVGNAAPFIKGNDV